MALIFTLEILTFVLTAVLIYHSLVVRGREFTLLFFITGFVLGILRENVVARITDLYSYSPVAFVLWIGAAPAILGVFWSFTIYISMSLSERLVRGDFLEGRRLVPIILLAMVFMGAYACFNEAMASTFPMVLWKFDPEIAIWGNTPVMVIFGYGGLSAIMLIFIYFIYRRGWKTWIKVMAGVLSTLVMIPLHLGWIALINFIIKTTMQ